MTETSPSPSPSPSPSATPDAPAATPSHRSRGPINSKYLDEVTLATDLVAQARLPENVPLLAARDCPPAEVTVLETAITALNRAALLAVGRSAARKLNTEEEQTARLRLLAALHPIRVGAKRSYRGAGNEAGRSAYFVNEPTNVSLERLLFIAGAVLLKLTPQPAPGGTGTAPPEDTLKGVTPACLADLATARAAYLDADADQTATGTQIGTLRLQVETRFAEVRAQRIDLQLAADQAFPHTNPAAAATRRAFHLPADRPAHE